MGVMNVANADVHGQSKDDAFGEEEEVSVKTNEDHADDSDEEYEFEWDGCDEIVVTVKSDKMSTTESVHVAKQLIESAAHRPPPSNCLKFDPSKFLFRT